MTLFDLHCHSTASDGSLTPQQLVERARQQGVDVLAITDHDTISGVRQVLSESYDDIRIIAGIELSNTWRNRGVHIVGLNLDVECSEFLTALAGQQQARKLRAELIAEKLTKLGVEAPLEGALRYAGDGEIGRPHFAEHMVATGFVTNAQQAFKKYLGAGKVGDIKNHWPTMATTISWIHAAGGQAVLAHPQYYKLTRTKLNLLLREFKEAGGDAMEVITARQEVLEVAYLAQRSVEMDLMASCGSDFHGDKTPWIELGGIPQLPEICTPVWRAWDEFKAA